MTSSRDRNGANSAPTATASQNGSNGAVTTEELTRATETNNNGNGNWNIFVIHYSSLL